VPEKAGVMLLSIDRAEAAHCADLADLIHRAFAPYRGRLVPESGAHAETPATLEAALGKGAAFRALSDGRLVGCIFTETRPDRLYLGRLAVEPDCRGQGVGAALLAAAETHARGLGLSCLELGVRLVLLDNIRLFQRAGFAIIRQESHKGFTEPTFHVMEKLLPPSPQPLSPKGARG
jgi:GNAT superfamily N-acetyltransferase